MSFSDAFTIWSVWLCHIHTPTVHSHLIPASRPTHLGRPGWWSLWAHCRGLAPSLCPACICALAPLDSPSHSTLRDLAIRLSFTFRRQLNSSCANTFTLNRACINDFMLESLCGGGSGILRRCSGCCSGGGLMGRSADVGWLFQGRTLVGSDGVEPAGLGWTSGSV